MQIDISANKLLGALYWAIYLSLCFIAGWFASGALNNFFLRRTSFWMNEEISTKRPVISIRLHPLSGEKTTLNNDTQINYCPSYKLWQYYGNISCPNLDLGENEFFIPQINKTEKVLFERIGSFFDNAYRIIPLTNLLEERATAEINILSLKGSLDRVTIFVTSLENSLGSLFHVFKDGNYLFYILEKNSWRKFLIKPESYYFLQQTSNCHDESYYDCIASELDRFDFNQTSCPKKCIPGMFSYGKNYSTPFCQTKKEDDCARNLFEIFFHEAVKTNFSKKVEMKCHHSCRILQYSAIETRNIQGTYKYNNTTDLFGFKYIFGNPNNIMKTFHEFLIYDEMGMIGSVGGTFGLFIGFSMTGVISSMIEFFKNWKKNGLKSVVLVSVA